MRISASLLESFRLWRAEDWMTTEKLIAAITGTEPASDAMALGSAWDAIVQEPSRYYRADSDSYQSGAYAFSGEGAREAIYRLPIDAIWQVKSTLDVDEHTLVAIADALHGTEITEVKATLNAFDAEKYLHSKQWRVMAAIFDATSITYHVTEWADGDEGEPLRLKACHVLPVYPYPDLVEELRVDMAEFAAFVHEQGLERVLDARGQMARR